MMSLSPKTVQLGEEAVRLVVSRMPALTSLKVSSWDIDYHWFMKEMREEGQHEHNIPVIEYEPLLQFNIISAWNSTLLIDISLPGFSEWLL